MSLLLDLPDDRRANKPWLPQDDRDVTNGLVVPDSIEWDGRPRCVTHGAMPRIDPHEGIYRCQECGVGARWLSTNHKESKIAFRKAWDERVARGRERADG